MIIDCMYFNGELDILEVRLNILNDFVDKFVIVESLITFSGKSKPLYFKENKERYSKWVDKIVYYVVQSGDKKLEQDAWLSPNTGSGESYWREEFYQKESLQKALTFCNDNDIVFISDVDEIWKVPQKVYEDDIIYKPKQIPYLYFFNQRTSENWLGWSGTIFTRYKNIKDNCINHLRTDSMTEYEVIENGGWHFNSIGGREQKQKAFSHPVYEDESVWKNREINLRKDDSDLPIFLIENKDKWKKHFLS